LGLFVSYIQLGAGRIPLYPPLVELCQEKSKGKIMKKVNAIKTKKTIKKKEVDRIPKTFEEALVVIAELEEKNKKLHIENLLLQLIQLHLKRELK
jgi:hypothetical protein